MSGKRYPKAFKIKAVKQVIERGHSFPASQHVLILLPIVFTPG